MIISEEEKKEILKKYDNKISSEVLTHLRRHFPVETHEFNIGDIGPAKMIKVDDKQHFIEKNKKFLVNKISNIIEDSFPSVDKPTLRRTVKFYLDFLK